ncbi:hypothetical protein R6Q57_014406 [Mikania cordata]
MQLLKNTTAFMAEVIHSQNPNANPPPHETFHRFFDTWITQQNTYLEELISAAKNHNHDQNGDHDTALVPLIERVVRHYEQYYHEKSDWERRDALAMLTPSWRSNLEDAFLWIGGWRPTLAVHLLYSKSGIQLDAKLEDLIRGLTTRDLGDLTPDQVKQIDELQKRTIHEERVYTEKLAKLQESVADRSMVELSNAVSEMIRHGNVAGNEAKVQSTLNSKNDEIETLLHMADDLRLEVLKAVVELLTPIQAVYFLIAAAELHLRLHEWGKKWSPQD